MSAANRFRQRTALAICAAVGILALARWISNHEPGKTANTGPVVQAKSGPAVVPTANGCYCVVDIGDLANFMTNPAGLSNELVQALGSRIVGRFTIGGKEVSQAEFSSKFPDIFKSSRGAGSTAQLLGPDGKEVCRAEFSAPSPSEPFVIYGPNRYFDSAGHQISESAFQALSRSGSGTSGSSLIDKVN